jgi:glycosyltransferase involved in cell wall biosynthesis
VSTRVSCIINAYDRPEFLREAIVSALSQTMPLHEVIVVDDHSPKDLGAVIAAFGDRVRHLRLPENRGLTAARNAGIAAATGEIVAFLDDDDRWLPNKIERQTAALGEGYDACLCGWQLMDGRYRQVREITEVTEDMLRRGNRFGGGTSLVARREALLAEPFDATIARGEDWDIYVRLAQRRSLAYVPEALFLYRSGDHDSMTRPLKHESPAQRLERGIVFDKHRRWLGERHYRDLLATYLLRSLSRRQAKHRHVLHAVRHAGLRATLQYLARWASQIDKRA